MIRKVMTLVTVAAMALAAQAQTSLGYSNGTIGRENVARYGSGKTQGMAIKLSREKVQMLKGQTITGIQAVYGSRNAVDYKAKLFVTTELGGTPLREEDYSIPSSPTTKWNLGTLSEPYTITGEEQQLYVGVYMEMQNNTYQALSVDFSKDTKDVSYVLGTDGWVDSYGFGLGCPNVRFVLADTPSITDAVVKNFQLDGYLKAGKAYQFSTELFNFGTETITSLDLNIGLNDEKPQTTHLTGLSIAPSSTYTLNIPSYTAQDSGDGSFTVSVSNINGGTDADATDNSVATDVFYYPADMERALLIEEFTGQACVNCPTGQRTLAACLAATKENTVEVLHHSGYQPDMFSMDMDYDLTCFYGSASTYAPACMVNRTAHSAAVPAFNVGANLVNASIEYCAKQHPYASLDLQTDYNASTREVTLKFSLFCHRDMPEGMNAINVMIVQDGLIGLQQGGGDTYIHNNVCRGSLFNNAFGAQLTTGTTAGTGYTWETTFTLPETILSDYWTDGQHPSYASWDDIHIPVVPENIRFVAYVAHYDNANILKNQVYNAIEAELGESTTQGGYVNAIDDVEVAKPVSTAVYDLSGRKLDPSKVKRGGIYIVGGKKVMM